MPISLQFLYIIKLNRATAIFRAVVYAFTVYTGHTVHVNFVHVAHIQLQYQDIILSTLSFRPVSILWVHIQKELISDLNLFCKRDN